MFIWGARDDFNGYMFTSIEEMVQRVDELLSDEILYNKLKENTTSSVECFSSELFGDRVEDIYMRVVNQANQNDAHSHTSLIG